MGAFDSGESAQHGVADVLSPPSLDMLTGVAQISASSAGSGDAVAYVC